MKRCGAITFAGRPGRFFVRCILLKGHARSHRDDINERLCA